MIAKECGSSLLRLAAYFARVWRIDFHSFQEADFGSCKFNGSIR